MVQGPKTKEKIENDVLKKKVIFGIYKQYKKRKSMKVYIENISKKLMKYNLIQLIMILYTINMTKLRPMHLQSWKHN